MDAILNKVDASGLVNINLEQFIVPGDRVLFDLKPWLFEEVMLREALFRDFVKQHDWSQYQSKLVAVHCTADAIIPTWAFMIVAASIRPYAAAIVFGDLEQLEQVLFDRKLNELNLDELKDQRVVVKGCSKEHVPVSAFVRLVEKLQPHVKSIMYGEPCSTVPVYKRKSS